MTATSSPISAPSPHPSGATVTRSALGNLAQARTPTRGLRREDELARLSRAGLIAEVRRLQVQSERQDVALGHAAEAVLTLRRGIEALRAQNRELSLHVQRLERAEPGADA